MAKSHAHPQTQPFHLYNESWHIQLTWLGWGHLPRTGQLPLVLAHGCHRSLLLSLQHSNHHLTLGKMLREPLPAASVACLLPALPGSEETRESGKALSPATTQHLSSFLPVLSAASQFQV